MATKLTLSLDEEVIKKAKQLSRRQGKSISKIVEDYLKNISGKEVHEETLVSQINKIMEPHRSKLKLPADVDYKEIIRQGRYEDYMNKTKNKY